MRTFSIAIVASLALLALVPLAAADEGDGYFSCTKPVTDVVEGAVDDTTEFLEQVQRDTIAFAEKMKCSVFETAGICSEEALVTPGMPGTTGRSHPHRRVCYEYMITSSRCSVGYKLRHYEYSNGQHSEACVPVYCGFIVEPPYRNELVVAGVGYRPCPPLPQG